MSEGAASREALGGMPPQASRARLLLGVAAAGVLLTAADTYVVVLALTDMMAGVGLGIEALQRATPIVSGFLLGYVAMLPLIGRISDLVDRRRVLLGCLLVFVVGSVITALAVELGVLVGGRFLQGVGGGGLVPATLALVADLWPPASRGVPLGVVGAVQELGAVVGPVFGAAVLAVTDWRGIFWIGALVALLLYAVLRLLPSAPLTEPIEPAAGTTTTAGSGVAPPEARSLAPDPTRGGQELRAATGPARAGLPRAPRRVGPVLGGLTAITGWLALAAPERLVGDLTIGLAYLPLGSSGSRLATPIGLVALALVAVLTAYLLWRGRAVLRRADPLGALLVAIALGSVILTFAGADPQREVVGPLGLVLLPAAALAVAALAWRVRRAEAPIIPPQLLRGLTLRATLVSACVGAALVAVVVDVPVLARLTLTDSQTVAAFVLLRFLGAVPIGAPLGGWLLRYAGPARLVAPGLLLASVGLLAMSRWERGALGEPSSTVLLVIVGLGLGLTLAPVNAAALQRVPPTQHGVASSLVVVARMMGMVVGLALLTAIGLHRYYLAIAALPDQRDTQALVGLGLVQIQTVFLGGAIAAFVGALVAGWLGGSPVRAGRRLLGRG